MTSNYQARKLAGELQHRITVPLKRPPMSANDQRRMHWTAQRKAKEQVGELVFTLARRAGLKDLGPSVVSVVWFAPDRRKRDSDSLGPFLKAALDGLVKAGVWPDDHSDWVRQTRMAIDKSQTHNARIEIGITEVSDNWRDDAVCQEIEQEVFFPGKSDSSAPARRICDGYCTVREQCLEAAMREEYGLGDHYRFGVRGGLGARARYKLALTRGEAMRATELEFPVGAA